VVVASAGEHDGAAGVMQAVVADRAEEHSGERAGAWSANHELLSLLRGGDQQQRSMSSYLEGELGVIYLLMLDLHTSTINPTTARDVRARF
jgi:hypothetical protein